VIVPAVVLNRSLILPFTEHGAEQGRFAGAVQADEGGDLTSYKLGVHAVEYDLTTASNAQVAEGNER